MGKTLVCNAEDVPENGMREFDVDGGTKVLVANSGGEFFAFQAICPHQDVPLCEGLYDGSVLTCHQHLWQWDIRSGAPIGLAEAPLQKFDLSVEDGALYLAPSGAIDVAELFSGIAAETLEEIKALARRREVDAGAALYQVGDPVDDIYVLDSGQVEFLVGREDRTSPAGFVLHKGEVFGWAALLDNQPRRIARATCLERSAVQAINGRALLKVLESDPASGYLVMRRLSELITRYLAASGSV